MASNPGSANLHRERRKPVSEQDRTASVRNGCAPVVSSLIFRRLSPIKRTLRACATITSCPNSLSNRLTPRPLIDVAIGPVAGIQRHFVRTGCVIDERRTVTGSRASGRDKCLTSYSSPPCAYKSRWLLDEGLLPPLIFGKPPRRSDRYISRPNDEGAIREDWSVRAVPAGVLKLVPVRATS